jgi:myo-inositol 2-dehydrogenase/D-chiro-inositol 1-dehydrogenase
MQEIKAPPRREFLEYAAGAAGLMILKPQTVFGSQANSAVEIGLVGCGNRGTWIAPFFPEYTGARIVAVADVVREKLDAGREKLRVDSSRSYYGPDAYRELANSKLDAVVIETPPYFHPEHVKAAVDAGKHVYMPKPVAVDVPGCHSIQESANRARGKHTFLVDLQTRARPVFQEAAERIHRGDIGKPALAQVYYYAGRVSRNPGRTFSDPGQARIMHFYTDRVLSGDIIVEQNIHAIDVGNWFLQSHPIKASGTGGRTDWTGTDFNIGDAWDHFVVMYWYPNDVHVTFSSNQLTKSFADVAVRCFGVNGAVDAHYGGLVRVTGPNAWSGTEKDDTFNGGAISNVKAFVDSIRTGKLLNNADIAVESTLTAILGRTAAYRQGEVVTWDDMMKANEKWETTLKLHW